MSEQEIFDKVKESIVGVLGVDEGEITKESTLIDDLGADSLDIVELIMDLEEKFDMEILDSEAEKMSKVEDIVNYIKEGK